MIHFFEKMEKEIDYLEEYRKLEVMISFEEYYVDGSWKTINDCISDVFREWEKRENYTTLGELICGLR